MLLIFTVFLIISLVGISFKKIKDIDEKALNPERTTMINGFFVGLILFSHFNSYAQTTIKIDEIYYYLFYIINQLMVTTFLFYSGYGILESIKNKKNYIKNFFKKRIVKLFVLFSTALILYIILNLLINNNYSLKTILLAFVGWESIGNSNWFMFAIFSMYFATLISFKIFKKDIKSAILLNTILSFVYIILVNIFKGYDWWYNIILCYNLGMFVSYYKEKIISLLKNNTHYYLILLTLLMIFTISYINYSNYFVFEIVSMSFVLIIFMITLKIKIGNKFLLWLGKNTFNIYILQRLVYILFDFLGLRNYNIYLYFIISILSIFLLSKIFDAFVKKITNILKLN